MKFLEAVAHAFADCDNLQKMCFVFPSRRSSLFFQKYLGTAAGKPIFCPRILTIDEFFEKLSPLKRADGIEALYLLFKDYLSVRPIPSRGQEEEETFDQFVYWGDILLRDFDDIDKYLADARKLLVNIANLKDLSVSYDFLSERQRQAISQFCRAFNAEETSADPTDKKRLFVTTWDLLLPLYTKFRETLAARNKGYAGMIYRDVVERGGYAEKIRKEFDKVVFVGLNALCECEKKLLDTLRDEGLADFYWDFRGPMVTDPDNRAGLFVRENVRRYKSERKIDDWEDGEAAKVEVISVPSAMGQTRVAGDILDDLQSKGLLGDCSGTAVVLPDENLLQPMLGAVSGYVSHINVTMGYPLGAGNAASFFSIVEHLQTNARTGDAGASFYHKDVLDMLEHPYLVRCLGNGEAGKKIAGHIRKENRIFVKESFLSAEGGLFSVIFRKISRTKDIPPYQMDIISALESFQTDREREFLYHYHRTIDTVSKLDIDWNISARTYYRILGQCIGLVSIPYRGEPLKGLQIMGPLETRALDFDNVIMLSVSEGVFPSRTVSASFIPYNIRIGFGLPTYEYHDAVWAYYFYRSICRAKRIYLIYDSRSSGLQSGEESRFIKQLRYQYDIPVRERVAAYSIKGGLEAEEETVIPKGESGPPYFSATALNTYIDCPVKYYWQYIKKLKESDEVVEELDAGLFGTIFHGVMQKIYEPLVGKKLAADDILGIRKDSGKIGLLVDREFRSVAGIGEIAGRNIILRQLVIRYVEQTLSIDAAMAPLTITGTEQTVDCQLDTGTRRVRLYGRIDRLDTGGDGVVRVVDYKSGRVDGKDNCDDVDKIFDEPCGKRPYIAFQLYFYALMMRYWGKGGDKVAYSQCIYSLKSMFSSVPQAQIIDPGKLDGFEKRLSALVDELLDESRPFISRKSNGSVCEYCDFKRLCGKR